MLVDMTYGLDLEFRVRSEGGPRLVVLLEPLLVDLLLTVSSQWTQPLNSCYCAEITDL